MRRPCDGARHFSARELDAELLEGRRPPLREAFGIQSSLVRAGSTRQKCTNVGRSPAAIAAERSSTVRARGAGAWRFMIVRLRVAPDTFIEDEEPAGVSGLLRVLT